MSPGSGSEKRQVEELLSSVYHSVSVAIAPYVLRVSRSMYMYFPETLRFYGCIFTCKGTGSQMCVAVHNDRENSIYLTNRMASKIAHPLAWYQNDTTMQDSEQTLVESKRAQTSSLRPASPWSHVNRLCITAICRINESFPSLCFGQGFYVQYIFIKYSPQVQHWSQPDQPNETVVHRLPQLKLFFESHFLLEDIQT